MKRINAPFYSKKPLLILILGILLLCLNVNSIVFAEDVLQTDDAEVQDDDSYEVEERDWSRYSYRYSYDLLNEDQKSFYDNMYDTCLEYLTTTKDIQYTKWLDTYYTEEIDAGSLERDEWIKVVSIFVMENPQFYFINTKYGSTDGSSKIKFIVDDKFSNGNDRAKITNDMFEIIDSSVLQISEGKTSRSEIEMAGRNLICDMVTYGKSTYHQSIYSVFIDHESVCNGYALAMEILMNAAGVPTVALISDLHAWNKVMLDDDTWYAVDVTWDDMHKYRFYNRSDEDMKYKDSESVKEHTAIYPEYYPDALVTMTHIDLADGRWVDENGGYHSGSDNGDTKIVPTPSAESYIITFTTASGRFNLSTPLKTIYYRVKQDNTVKYAMDSDKDSYDIIKVIPDSEEYVFAGYKIKNDTSGNLYVCDIDYQDSAADKKYNIYNYVPVADTVFEAVFELYSGDGDGTGLASASVSDSTDESESETSKSSDNAEDIIPAPQGTEPQTVTDNAISTDNVQNTSNNVENDNKEDTIAGNGSTVTISGSQYIVTSTNTLTYVSTENKDKSVIDIPASVKIKGHEYFVTSVSDNAFKNNKKLTKVTIGKNVTKIGKNAYSGCKNLKTITIKSAKITSIGKNAFKGIKKNATIKVPKKQLKKYKKLLKKAKLAKTVKVK